MTIKEGIERLAEINSANTIMMIGEELRNERQIIVKYLKDMDIIQLYKNGVFNFVGVDSDENKRIYLDVFENF